MSVLRVEKLCRSFGSLVVTNQVSLTIEPGERHVVIGPNGAGKTSFINQIAGQLAPSSGRIFLQDRDITGRPPNWMAHHGVARTFQRNNLFQNLSVLENVRLAVQARQLGRFDFFRPVRKLTALSTRAEQILGLVHLAGRAADTVGSISYGEQRQLEIGVALASDPELLLLDEPTSGMSPAETAGMIELVASLPKSLAILMIEHDMKVVFSVADRITVLYYGEVLASGAPAEIQADQRVREVYLGVGH